MLLATLNRYIIMLKRTSVSLEVVLHLSHTACLLLKFPRDSPHSIKTNVTPTDKLSYIVL